MMELPKSYCERMKSLLGSEYPDYLASLEEPCAQSLRLHTGKWNEETAQDCLPFLEEPVPWAEGGFYYREGAQPSRHPAYSAGLYYLQEASAMSPGAVLPVEEGERILDLCAAPGGKATQVADRLGSRGVLYANDISASRAQALRKNLELAGVRNVFVTAETPEKLAAAYPEYFDKILVDAPCSGEGMFRRDSALLRDWIARGPACYAPLQAEILEQAVHLLRPGGLLLYSTCTFSREENEENVERLLTAHPEMTLQPITPRPGFSEGFLPGTVRLWPHRVRGEGHFLALLEKTGEKQERRRPSVDGAGRTGAVKSHDGRKKHGRRKGTSPRESLCPPDWEARLSPLLTGRKLMRREDVLYALPEWETPHPGLRYLRTGLLLGTWKRERFAPSQALAMALERYEYPDRVSFGWEDERVLRYLKGESVDAAGAAVSGEEGWCLVCAEEYPLGWAMRRGTALKNKYEPGWRRQ
ncbi:MAG: RsmB/NOP family class I SAM-dependent RNA methyltransferase [Lachnospiraceae bacterium]|nr:RsmB/NOP family class I SAM-dependent RNA methyltransferase [Lachnospiraceae bacterium]